MKQFRRNLMSLRHKIRFRTQLFSPHSPHKSGDPTDIFNKMQLFPFRLAICSRCCISRSRIQIERLAVKSTVDSCKENDLNVRKCAQYRL